MFPHSINTELIPDYHSGIDDTQRPDYIIRKCILSRKEIFIYSENNQVTNDSNRSLGLAGASRNGTRQAIPPDYYRHVLEMARIKDPGLAAALELSRLLGLRSQEAVQSAQSLRTWQQALERGDTRFTVIFGTKGGRPRETIILDAGAVRKVLDNALSVAESRHGRLIDKPDLKSAMKYWHSQASRIGLTVIALRVGAGCYSSLSGAGIQRKRGAGNDGDGFGPR